MTKIKDIKGIVEKLPCVHYLSTNKYILNTELDINEIAELDVEGFKKLILEEYGRDENFNNNNGHKNATINVMRRELWWLAKAIAKTGILKWREI